MPRLFAPLLALSLLLLAGGAQASYITRTLNKPVPGGVVHVDLRDGELVFDFETTAEVA